MVFFGIEKSVRIGNKVRHLRINQELQDKINWLLQNDGELQNETHVIRCAINAFYDKKKKEKEEGKVTKLGL